MAQIPFYDHLGKLGHAPPAPSALPFDCVLASELQSLVKNVSHVLSTKITSTILRAASDNLTLEALLEDGQSVIVRKILPTKDVSNDKWGARKLIVEAHLLAWLQASSPAPVPRVLSPLSALPLDEPDPEFFFVADKLPGTVLLNQYGLLDVSAKERLVVSFAKFKLKMFRLNVPQSIGSLLPAKSSELGLNIVPRIGVQSHQATKVFEDVCEYFDFLLQAKKRSDSIGESDGGHIDELGVHIYTLLDDLKSKSTAHSLLRCVLSHEDLNDQNILIDERGEITGVVDWEYQIVKPAFLAADYPPWLSYDACMDPRFADTYYTVWLESPQESKRLRDLYSQIVKAQDEEYWNALVQGQALRSCIKWLVYMPAVDEGCARMKQWMDVTFSSLDGRQDEERYVA
ncbi:hypothetical protein H0H87_002195 [Tephrocybe sp. NHM501043]|nr:hypothetical protein H0H87_002195 [Tephrocybe sp. NHM501043]